MDQREYEKIKKRVGELKKLIAETQKRSHRNSEHPGRFLSGTDLVEDRERPSSAPKSPSTTNETTINKHRS